MAVLEMEIGRGADHLKEVSIDLGTGATAITLIPTQDERPGQGIELTRSEFLAVLAAFRAADAAIGQLQLDGPDSARTGQSISRPPLQTGVWPGEYTAAP